MAGGRLKIAVVVSGGLLLLAAGLGIVRLVKLDPLVARVDQVLKKKMLPGENKWQEGMDDLWALGPGVIPQLAAESRRRDSLLLKRYTVWWQKAPAFLKRHLPAPVDRGELRQAAMHAIVEFGPLAVRQAAPQVIEGLGETDDRYNNYAVRGMPWLASDSPAAFTSFKQGLAGIHMNWSRPRSFLDFDGDDTGWPKIPEVVPLVTNYLWNAGEAYMGAIVLGRIGSNTAVALPALIQVADIGAAGTFSNARAAHLYQTEGFSSAGRHIVTAIQDDKGMNHNRAMAALAMGRIGLATPEVRAALVRTWDATDPWVRHNAALAVAMLGPAMSNEVPGLLAGLNDTDNSALESKLEAIRSIGPGAGAALETLRELTQTNRLRALVVDPNSNVVSQSVEELSVAAKMAICELAPEEGRPFLPDIASEIGRWWEPVVFLSKPGPLSYDVVRAVEPLLEQDGSQRQSLAAYVILHHNPQHAGALAALRRNESVGALNDRLEAGSVLFQTVGETNGLCALITEAFRSPESFPGQGAGQIADKMGLAALPALPAFKEALWHKDVFVRQYAGRLVLKLAPRDLPVNEGR